MIIFDLDGTLADCEYLYSTAVNMSLMIIGWVIGEVMRGMD